MPCDYKNYPPDWKTRIVPAIKERAKNYCEFCGAVNGLPNPATGSNVVLTVAHLDHDPKNHDVSFDRLAALCQRCHFAYDRKENIRRRKEKQTANQPELPMVNNDQ